MKGHPLFPSDDEDDDRDISWIRIVRSEATGWVWVPRRFSAEDLTSLEDIHRLFGGGHYELIAKDINDRFITHRQKYTIPGHPLPLVPGSESPPLPNQAPSGPLSSFPVATASAPVQPSMDSNVIGLMMQMQQQQQQMMMQVMMQQTQMMTAFVTASKQDAHTLIDSMSKHSESMANSQGQFYSAMIAGTQGRQSAPPDQAKDFLALGLKLGQTADPVSKVDNSLDFMSSIGGVMDVFKTMASMPVPNSMQPPPPPSFAPPAPLPDFSPVSPVPVPVPDSPPPKPSVLNDAFSLRS